MTGVVVWFTGLPRSGKSTLAEAVRSALAARGQPAVALDGDAVRAALVPRPGYDPDARDDFYASLANLAGLIATQGHIVLVPATAHRRQYRQWARERAPRFVEVHVATALEECAARDTLGLYASAEARDALPGAGVTYESPLTPDVVARGGHDATALALTLDLVASLR